MGRNGAPAEKRKARTSYSGTAGTVVTNGIMHVSPIAHERYADFYGIVGGMSLFLRRYKRKSVSAGQWRQIVLFRHVTSSRLQSPRPRSPGSSAGSVTDCRHHSWRRLAPTPLAGVERRFIDRSPAERHALPRPGPACRCRARVHHKPAVHRDKRGGAASVEGLMLSNLSMSVCSTQASGAAATDGEYSGKIRSGLMLS